MHILLVLARGRFRLLLLGLLENLVDRRMGPRLFRLRLAQARLLAHMGVAAAALHAAWQMSRLEINEPLSCLRLFRSNRDFGLLLLLGLLLDTLTR